MSQCRDERALSSLPLPTYLAAAATAPRHDLAQIGGSETKKLLFVNATRGSCIARDEMTIIVASLSYSHGSDGRRTTFSVH